MEYRLDSLAELPDVARQFVEDFVGPKTFAFDAPMGAGKTTFITAVLHAMGIQETDGSPTYGLVNTYESHMFGKVYHYDVYRLTCFDEAYDIGMDEVLYSNAVCFVEWAEKIDNLLPEDTIWVYIRMLEDNSRIITIKP